MLPSGPVRCTADQLPAVGDSSIPPPGAITIAADPHDVSCRVTVQCLEDPDSVCFLRK